MSLKNWAYICLNNYCVASIQGNTYISYERFIRMHFGELGVDFERRLISVNKQLVQEYKIKIGSKANMHYDTK